MNALPAFVPGLAAGQELNPEQAARAAGLLLDPGTSDADRAAFLTALTAKGETAAELAAFARALLPLALPVPRPAVPGPLLDCCGTGGGGYPLFNVSTALLFVLSAAGVPVVKHGNRGVTKPSGSADVVAALGLKVELTPEEAKQSVEETGFAFLHAPAFHPAFQVLAPVRQALGARGKRTIFNLLGPLLNPFQPEARLVGVFRDAHVALYGGALHGLGVPRFAVVYGQAGGQPLGEVSPSATADNRIAANFAASALPDFKMEQFDPSFLEPLKVKDAAQSAILIEKLLRREGLDALGFGYALILFNAGMALAVQGKAASVLEGVSLARDAIESGAALRKLEAARAWAKGR